MSTPQPVRPISAFLVAPRKRHRRSRVERQLSSPRGRFEVSLIGGGAVALVFAATLPGLPEPVALVVFALGGLAMAGLATIVGFVPALAAALFAPLVVALSDPMWTLGATLSDFTLATESSLTFAVFTAAALVGAVIRTWIRRRRRGHRHAAWRLAPR